MCSSTAGMSALELAIRSFFRKEDNYTELCNVFESRLVQPRLIDFYVTQYAKNSPQFFIPEIDGMRYGLMDVYSSYKLQLKGYHKKLFNLFDKKKIIRIISPSNSTAVEMSVPQLNVYRWLVDNKILSIINENLADIQIKYYEFRKSSMRGKQSQKTSKKRGKMSTFIKSPIIIKGLSITEQK
jgi:hypothetical protein